MAGGMRTILLSSSSLDPLALVSWRGEEEGGNLWCDVLISSQPPHLPGKTELAKQIAKYLHKDNKQVCGIDCAAKCVVSSSPLPPSTGLHQVGHV